MACTCVKQEVGKGSGKVRGYVTTIECSECRERREADNKKRAEQKILDDAVKATEELIQAKTRTLAIEALTKEGKLK